MRRRKKRRKKRRKRPRLVGDARDKYFKNVFAAEETRRFLRHISNGVQQMFAQ